jgi:hypothetical protein
MDLTLVEKNDARYLSMHKKRDYSFYSGKVMKMFERIPDTTCFFCDGVECKIKRILDRIAFGHDCLVGDSGGKKDCKLFNRANKEGLILFMTKDA